MPHKHKRRQKDEKTYDLPPTVVAKPLPARAPTNESKSKKRKQKKAKPYDDKYVKPSKLVDDTPKEFARLMQWQKTGKIPKGLDDPDVNNKRGKKRKRGEKDDEDGKEEEKPALKIMPGEKLSDFAARVDQALPLSGMKKSQRPASKEFADIREGRITKHEKKLRKLQKHWREEEARLREKEAEERDLKETEEQEIEDMWRKWGIDPKTGKAPKKKKNKSGVQGKAKNRDNKKESDADNVDDGDDDDPWAKLQERDRAAKANPFEVAHAPPQALPKPREVFKVRRGAGVDVANVPSAAGSLRRREELAEERKSVVEQYRRLMAEKRQSG
ncbi:hypothetical protein VTN49DRAFT_8099 [Thermomyces lanuginosus]|uniref:uncharacterized protein n=1 Tax=Thermomyces lanuginosus TaxID=5541 RepID=UPI003742A09C